MNEYYMNKALLEAKKAQKKKEVPVGAIIVKNDKIISKAYNLKETRKNSTYHAEVIAIQKACRKLKNWRLEECTLYVTLEPCMMCCGAILQSRIKKIVYGAMNPKFGYAGSIDNLLQSEVNNHKVEIESGVLEQESAELLKQFFLMKRK